MSSYPVTSRDTSLVADLRTQLFGVKAELEKERTERQSAMERIAELEAQVRAMSIGGPASLSFVSNIIPPTPFSPEHGFVIPSVGRTAQDCPTTPTPDPGSRMRAWGFPQGPVQPSSSRNNRESFFGLSQVLRRGSEERQPDLGVDLPPFSLSGAFGDTQMTPRAVSEPTPHVSSTDGPMPMERDESRSVSLTSSASNALSFLTDYIPGYTRSTSPSIDQKPASQQEDRVKVLSTAGHVGVLDFSTACKCCVGDVMEV